MFYMHACMAYVDIFVWYSAAKCMLFAACMLTHYCRTC